MVVDINDSKIFVWLSKGMFKDLKEKINAHNENLEIKDSLNFGIAAYFLNLPTYLGSIKKDKYEDGWIPICSEIFKNVKNSSKYFEFLVENKFLIVHPSKWSSIINRCRRFRLATKYDKHVLKFHSIEVNKKFYDKRLEEQNKRLIEAKNSTPHLIKWLDKSSLFSIDYKSAMAYINQTFQGSNKVKEKKYRIIALDNFKHNIIRYSREGKDNRLHSILTSLPKDLKPYIKFDNQNLASIDITNCQPYILATIFESILINDTNRIFKSYLNNNSIPNMSDLIKNEEKIKGFIDEIVSGGFYYAFGDKLYKEGVLMTNTNDYYYFADYKNTKSAKGLKIKKFENRREAAKHVMMKILFTAEDYSGSPVQVFNKYYPEAYSILKAIKTNKKEDLPVLLQNIEADCILDYCSLKIALKHPEMPLFTIHDSLVTIEANIEILQSEFKIHLADYFKISPSLKVEYWNNKIQNDLRKAG